jgi:hypothetical protein
LRAANINSLYLVLVLSAAWCWRKGRPTLAGVLLAVSVSLKIYSIVLLLYLLSRKEWRTAWAMVVALVVLFVVVPGVAFGWHDSFSLSRSWVHGVLTTSRPDYCIADSAYKVSLSWIALLLMNPQASGGTLNLLSWSTAAVALAVKTGCLAWGLLVACYFADASRIGTDKKRENLTLALDISVLLFCAFPASALLQPHHLVVLVVPAICLIHVAFDGGFSTQTRIVAGLTVGLGYCLTHFGPRYPLRGVGVMATLAVYLLGIWLTRRACRPVAAVPVSAERGGDWTAASRNRLAPAPLVTTSALAADALSGTGRLLLARE